MQKARITVALCSNATGTDRLKPLIINNAQRPQTFGKEWKPNELCNWYSNKEAWMMSFHGSALTLI